MGLPALLRIQLRYGPCSMGWVGLAAAARFAASGAAGDDAAGQGVVDRGQFRQDLAGPGPVGRLVWRHDLDSTLLGVSQPILNATAFKIWRG